MKKKKSGHAAVRRRRRSSSKLVDLPFLTLFSFNWLPFLVVHDGAAMCGVV